MSLRRRRWPVRRLISCCAAILCVYPRRRSSRSSTPARSLTRGLRASWGFLEPWEAVSLPLGLLDVRNAGGVFTLTPPQVAPQGRWVDVPDARSCPPPVEQGPTQTAYLVPGYPNTRSRAQGPFRRIFACLRASGRGSRGASGREGTRILGLQGKSHLFEHERGHPHTHATRLYDPRYPPPAPPSQAREQGWGGGEDEVEIVCPLPPWITHLPSTPLDQHGYADRVRDR